MLRDRASLFIADVLRGRDASRAHARGAQEDAGPLDEITVTGSRIVRDGITAPTPVTVVSAERLQNLGATNIGQVLNTLPSFRASSNPQTANIQPRAAGTSLADLRGLGTNRTLVLVNGRRFVPSTLEGAVDLNQIPTLADRPLRSRHRRRLRAIRLGCRGGRGEPHPEERSGRRAHATAVRPHRRRRWHRTTSQASRAAPSSRRAAGTSPRRSSTRRTKAPAIAIRATGARRNIRSSPIPTHGDGAEARGISGEQHPAVIAHRCAGGGRAGSITQWAQLAQARAVSARTARPMQYQYGTVFPEQLHVHVSAATGTTASSARRCWWCRWSATTRFSPATSTSRTT